MRMALRNFESTKRGAPTTIRVQALMDTTCAIAPFYAAGMLYAGGAKFLLLLALLYAPGTALFIVARREQKKACLYAC
jgi:hypothetical protein